MARNTTGQRLPSPPGALRRHVTRRLLAAVFRRELPPNALCTMKSLAHRFGVSATPIREAFIELEKLDIVELPCRRGVVFRPFGREQLRDMFQLRTIFEHEAVLCAAERIEPARPWLALRSELNRFLQDYEEDCDATATRFSEIDHKSLECICCRCGNTRLAHELCRYALLTETIAQIVPPSSSIVQEAARHLLTTINSLLASDPSAAAKATSRRLTMVATFFEDRLFGEPVVATT